MWPICDQHGADQDTDQLPSEEGYHKRGFAHRLQHHGNRTPLDTFGLTWNISVFTTDQITNTFKTSQQDLTQQTQQQQEVEEELISYLKEHPELCPDYDQFKETQKQIDSICEKLIVEKSRQELSK